ncbi:unnamed protein product [Ophioblennius macclurei]
MDDGIWGKTYRKSQSEHIKGNTNQASEMKTRERVKREMDQSDVDQNIEQKAADRPRGKQFEECSPPVLSNASHSQQERLADISLEILPCKICNRKFVRERLETHVRICKKVKQARRPVYNSYAHRTKGSSAEEFFKTHTRSKTPEIIKKKYQGRKETSKQHQDRPPAATTQPTTSKKTQLKSRK